jgi:hypothetical protein
MKKILVIGLISSFFSAGAFAAACTATATTSSSTPIAAGATTGGTAATEQCVCDGGAAVKSTVNGGKGQTATTPIFLQSGFDVQCSANTIVSYNEVSSTGFAVGSGSKKGNQSFKGSSAGGGIAKHLDCAASGCIATDVTAANVQAALDSSS